MSWKAIVLAATIACALAAPGLATTYTSADGSLKLEAQTISGNPGKLVAEGKAHVYYADGAKKTCLDAYAEKIVVTTMSVPAPKTAKNSKPVTSVKCAVLSGPVKMIYAFVDANGASKVTAMSDNADYDGVANLAQLTGNVKVIDENLTLYAEPATMVGDKATINLKPGPDDFRFRIESAPGLSSLSATPKPKPEAQKKQ